MKNTIAQPMRYGESKTPAPVVRGLTMTSEGLVFDTGTGTERHEVRTILRPPQQTAELGAYTTAEAIKAAEAAQAEHDTPAQRG